MIHKVYYSIRSTILSIMVVLFYLCAYNKIKMKSLHQNQEGLIPLLLTILAAVIAVIVLVFMRVKNAN